MASTVGVVICSARRRTAGRHSNAAGVQRRSPPERLIEPVCRPTLLSGTDLAVGVRRDRVGRVAQVLLHDFRVGSGRQQRARRGVPQRVRVDVAGEPPRSLPAGLLMPLPLALWPSSAALGAPAGSRAGDSADAPPGTRHHGSRNPAMHAVCPSRSCHLRCGRGPAGRVRAGHSVTRWRFGAAGRSPATRAQPCPRPGRRLPGLVRRHHRGLIGRTHGMVSPPLTNTVRTTSTLAGRHPSRGDDESAGWP